MHSCGGKYCIYETPLVKTASICVSASLDKNLNWARALRGPRVLCWIDAKSYGLAHCPSKVLLLWLVYHSQLPFAISRLRFRGYAEPSRGQASRWMRVLLCCTGALRLRGCEAARLRGCEAARSNLVARLRVAKQYKLDHWTASRTLPNSLCLFQGSRSRTDSRPVFST